MRYHRSAQALNWLLLPSKTSLASHCQFPRVFFFIPSRSHLDPIAASTTTTTTTFLHCSCHCLHLANSSCQFCRTIIIFGCAARPERLQTRSNLSFTDLIWRTTAGPGTIHSQQLWTSITSFIDTLSKIRKYLRAQVPSFHSLSTPAATKSFIRPWPACTIPTGA